MSQFEIVMPKLGESITEATIIKWFKQIGDTIDEDDVLLEIATDKVDSEIPSPVAGKIVNILFKEGDIVPVGSIIAVISLTGEDSMLSKPDETAQLKENTKLSESNIKETKSIESSKNKFYSPLVKTIARQENLSQQEIDAISGTGMNGRVRKEDILSYIQLKKSGKTPPIQVPTSNDKTVITEKSKVSVSISAEDQIIEMDRVRKAIADHMVHSKHTAPHVTNFVEADVTELVQWRNKVKDAFLKREKINLTYMPVFLEAITRALRDFPHVNASVNGYDIILKKNINIGVAVSLPTGNLIVPVVKNADHLNLLGLTKELYRLAEAARSNKLNPDDIQGGTFTISNFGTFKNSFGTPIINQPQAAILATGNIEKKPAVIETPGGDVIAIRHKMFLSLTYDHRIIDGALGGAFLRRIADYLENFDITRTI